MAGYLPQSEGDLLRARPGSNRARTFPPPALLGDEKILFEARPQIIALHPVLFWGSLPFVILFALVAVVGAGQLTGSALDYATLALILLLMLAPLLVIVGLWSRTSYALTDQRAVARSGDSFDSVALVRVQSVRLGRKSSTVVFDLAPDPSEPHHGLLGSRPPTLEWKGVPGAPGVATYANSAVRFYQMRQRQKQLRDAIVTSSMQDRVVCEYCRAMIPVSSLDRENPRCPRCMAPVLIAPLGI